MADVAPKRAEGAPEMTAVASKKKDRGFLLVRFLSSTVHLFTASRFLVHRLFGLLYLLQFGAVVTLELRGKPDWLFFVTMPITGFLQSIVANCTFTFLPKADEGTQGYYHETRVMSYDFIRENIYFAGLLLFQSLYLAFNGTMRANGWWLPLEIVMVFFPYYTFRDFFPKSSFRHSTKQGNRFASVTKFFYVSSKHYNGYYINYLAFLGHFSEDPLAEWSLLRNMLILGGWGTTIAMFLQTLKFKRYISATTAMVLYAGVFPLFWSVYVGLAVAARDQLWLTALTTVGLVINFGSRKAQLAFQAFMAALLLGVRFGFDFKHIALLDLFDYMALVAAGPFK